MDENQLGTSSSKRQFEASQHDDMTGSEKRKKTKLAAVYADEETTHPPPAKPDPTLSGPEIKFEPDNHPQTPSEAKVSLRTKTENALRAAKARGIPTEYFRIAEDGSVEFGPSEEETALWKEVIEHKAMTKKGRKRWEEVGAWGRRVLEGSPMPTAEETIELLVRDYYAYTFWIFPVKILKAILEEDGTIDEGMTSGKQRKGRVSNLKFRQSLEMFSPAGIDVEYIVISLQPRELPRSFLRDYVAKIQIPPLPGIFRWYFRHHNARDQVQAAMKKIRNYYGFYEEFDWDEFGLGVVIH